jgi:hypothetical protein
MTGGFHESELAVQRRRGRGRGTRLHVHASPAEGDPLQGLPGGQRVGLLAIEFARRRRVRAVRFTPDRVVSGSVALHAGDVARYGRNPPLT